MATTYIVKVLGYGHITDAVLNAIAFTGGTYTTNTDYIQITGNRMYESFQMSYNTTYGSSIQESFQTYPVSIIAEKSAVVFVDVINS